MQEGKENEDKKKKKEIAFKSTTKHQEEEEDDTYDDEEMTFITKKFKRFVKKKQDVQNFFKKDFNNRDFPRGENHNNPEHYKSECPELKK